MVELAGSALLGEVEALHRSLLHAGEVVDLASVHAAHRMGAMNLAHFLELRSEDRRGLQAGLAELGLSSLGRCEAHVLVTVAAVRRALRAVEGLPVLDDDVADGVEAVPCAASYLEGPAALQRHARSLLGDAPDGRTCRIMVTLPSEAAHDRDLVDALVEHGMQLARINCAHDDATAWKAMAANVRDAAARRGRPVRIMIDLAGPKLRTGPMPPSPAALRLRPRRNERGIVESPALALLVPNDQPWHKAALPLVPVTASFLRRLVPGDKVSLEDARGARRVLRVTTVNDAGAVVAASRTTYLADGTLVRFKRHESPVGPLRTKPGRLVVHRDDEVLLRDDDGSAKAATTSARAEIGCTLPEAVAALDVGHRVLIDDGKVAARVVAKDGGGAVLRIENAEDGAKIRAEKGINLPDTTLPVAALTEKDCEDLAAVVELADIVALSFVRERSDVQRLLDELRSREAPSLGVVLKIETARAFAQLPELIRTAMAHEDLGVMIARGDLAVEVGYERLAELQEEILWLCEAAHLPVIWATDVLAQLARTGQPSRSEITDAAMSHRAECVMLNKGPHIAAAVGILDDILRRMAEHQTKKSPQLRQLRSWYDLPGGSPGS